MPKLTEKRLVALLMVVAIASMVRALPMIRTWTPGPQAGFWVLVLTALAAIWYAWLTYRLLRGQQTPTLVVEYRCGRTVVRNFGFGAALNISLTDRKGRTLGRAGDLKAGGQVVVAGAIDWTMEAERHVFCQDVGGRWHMTMSLGQALTSSANIPIANKVIGRVFSPPPEARQAAVVLSAVEEFVRRHRTWDPRNWVMHLRYKIRKRSAEGRIMRLIREAQRSGRLHEPFSPADVSVSTELEGVITHRFVANHLVGNPDGEREFFTGDPGGGYRLK